MATALKTSMLARDPTSVTFRTPDELRQRRRRWPADVPPHHNQVEVPAVTSSPLAVHRAPRPDIPKLTPQQLKRRSLAVDSLPLPLPLAAPIIPIIKPIDTIALANVPNIGRNQIGVQIRANIRLQGLAVPRQTNVALEIVVNFDSDDDMNIENDDDNMIIDEEYM
jgi:hypothetical protein